MEFTIEHVLDAPLEQVERRLLAPDFVAALAGASRALSQARLLRHEDRGAALEREAWFRADGRQLAPAFARLGAIAWFERVTWSRAEHRGHFVVTPDVRPALARRVSCVGTYALVAESAARTTRVVRGEVVVRAPVLARAAEAHVVALLERLFADEAALLGGTRAAASSTAAS